MNTVAEYFLSLLPSTDGDYHQARLRLISDVRILSQGLANLSGLHAYPTGANFVLIRILNGKTAAEIQERLLHDHGLYVRDCSNKVGMDRFDIRVASQGRENDAKLIAALKEVLS